MRLLAILPLLTLATAARADAPAERYRVDLGQSPLRGAKDALVTVVVWSDYQCPFCARLVPTLERLLREHPNELRIAWKDQPLPFHPRARDAALAARAAGRQGKYWQMHDAIFSHPTKLEDDDLERRATEIGLDLARFRRDRDDKALADVIDADSAQGVTLGAHGTPTSFVNGRMVRGAQPFEAFDAVVTEELAAARALARSGVPVRDVYARTVQGGRTSAPPPPAPPRPAPPVQDDKTIWRVPVEGAFAKGPATAPVTIVVWNDFQCPFCGRLAMTIKELSLDLGQEIRVVHRDQPLPFHKDAKLAAVAARAAGAQGRFFDMHDKLFLNQQALDRDSLERYALELGLDMKRFRAALDDPRLGAAVEADAKAGEVLGATGTPTSFVNGRRIVGAHPIETFRAVIEQEKVRAKAMQKRGVKPAKLYEALVKDGKTRDAER